MANCIGFVQNDDCELVNTEACVGGYRAGFKCVEALGRIIIVGWTAGRTSGL